MNNYDNDNFEAIEAATDQDDESEESEETDRDEDAYDNLLNKLATSCTEDELQLLAEILDEDPEGFADDLQDIVADKLEE